MTEKFFISTEKNTADVTVSFYVAAESGLVISGIKPSGIVEDVITIHSDGLEPQNYLWNMSADIIRQLYITVKATAARVAAALARSFRRFLVKLFMPPAMGVMGRGFMLRC